MMSFMGTNYSNSQLRVAGTSIMILPASIVAQADSPKTKTTLAKTNELPSMCLTQPSSLSQAAMISADMANNNAWTVRSRFMTPS